jgi:hypothetical protein
LKSEPGDRRIGFLRSIESKKDLKPSSGRFIKDEVLPWCSGLACESVTLTTRVQIPAEAPLSNGLITQSGRVPGFYGPADESYTALMKKSAVQRYQGAAGSNPVGPIGPDDCRENSRHPVGSVGFSFSVKEIRPSFEDTFDQSVIKRERQRIDPLVKYSRGIVGGIFSPAKNFVESDIKRCKI